jgi:hypothetical protein
MNHKRILIFALLMVVGCFLALELLEHEGDSDLMSPDQGQSQSTTIQTEAPWQTPSRPSIETSPFQRREVRAAPESAVEPVKPSSPFALVVAIVHCEKSQQSTAGISVHFKSEAISSQTQTTYADENGHATLMSNAISESAADLLVVPDLNELQLVLELFPVEYKDQQHFRADPRPENEPVWQVTLDHSSRTVTKKRLEQAIARGRPVTVHFRVRMNVVPRANLAVTGIELQNVKGLTGQLDYVVLNEKGQALSRGSLSLHGLQSTHIPSASVQKFGKPHSLELTRRKEKQVCRITLIERPYQRYLANYAAAPWQQAVVLSGTVETIAGQAFGGSAWVSVQEVPWESNSIVEFYRIARYVPDSVKPPELLHVPLEAKSGRFEVLVMPGKSYVLRASVPPPRTTGRATTPKKSVDVSYYDMDVGALSLR